MKTLSFIQGELPDFDFQYTVIDEKALEMLKRLDFRELGLYELRIETKKWCIDTHNSIALLYSGWVSSSIAQAYDNSSFWYFLLIVNGMQTRIEIIRQGSSLHTETHPILQNEIEISADFAEKCDFTVEHLKGAVCEAIKVFESGKHRDFEENLKKGEIESATRTPDKIMRGEFSTILRQCIDSITEIENVEHLFRLLCLTHFRKHNMEVQHYNGFYLHDDEGSFFIFDVILWMYLHNKMDVTIDGFMSDYPNISNPTHNYLRDDFEAHFCLAGAISFLKEGYFPRRIEEEKIVIKEGKVQFTPRYMETIVKQLRNSY